MYYFIQYTGITPVENLHFNFSLIDPSSWLIWSPPLFSSENTPLSYHIYIENQHGQLVYNDITEDTSYELYNLTVCDIYTATVIAHSGQYSSSNVTIQDEYNESKCVMLNYVFFNVPFILQRTVLLFYLIMRSSLMISVMCISKLM